MLPSRAGYCQELQLERLFAGPEAAAPPAGGAGGKGGGGVLSFKGWTLDMVQVLQGGWLRAAA